MDENSIFDSKLNTSNSHKLSKIGWFVISLTGGAAIIISVICFPFISPALRRICLPYVPATHKQISNVFEALKGCKGNLLDIGSGDGRIVIKAAKKGFTASGVELNYWLVLYSRWIALLSGCSKSASFYHRNLWKFPLQSYNNIVIFGVQEMMEELECKMNKELVNAHVAACRFPIPNKKPVKVIGEGIDTVWLYYYRKQ